MDQQAVINAGEPTGAEASRETQLKVASELKLIRRRHGFTFARKLIEPLAIGVGDSGHIGGIFEPPFNLQAGHAGIDQIGKELPRSQILR